MLKVQFASGPNLLDGWTNLQEHNGDITKRLPFNDDEVSFILIEHGLEHVNFQHAFRFLQEAHRILKSGGVIRIIVPSVDKIWNLADEDYINFMSDRAPEWWPAAGLPIPKTPVTKSDCVEAIIFCHGHKSCWTEDMLAAFVGAAGFDVRYHDYGESLRPELNGVDRHGTLMGWERCKMESVVIEGMKR